MEREMVKVNFLTNKKIVEVKIGTTLLEAAQKAGIHVEAICGGIGTCGKCKMIMTKGNCSSLTQKEKQSMTMSEIQRGMRLACQAIIKEDSCVILPTEKKEENHFIIKNRSAIEVPSRRRLGVAIDIGTTTVAMSVMDIERKQKMISCSFYNPQRCYGADVIARMAYCLKNEKNAEQVTLQLIDTCNIKIKEMLNKIGYSVEDVVKIILVCNTVMSHIVMGESLEGISKAPFQPKVHAARIVRASNLGFRINRNGMCYLLSNIGGYVGSDALAGIIYTKIHQKLGTCLLLDIGTNGEIILCNDYTCIACSTAAGPAFEGAGLAMGMCATEGAITEVNVDQSNIRVKTVGGKKPIGISGSGVIDAIAGLVQVGKIEESGYVAEEELTQLEKINQRAILLCGNEEDGIGITREDIRQIQLAKAAIRAGIETLLSEYNLQKDDLDNIYIAGSFGSNLSVASAMNIGLLPRIKRDRIHSVGNTALKGAEMILVNENKWKEANELAAQITFKELANDEKFRKTFINAMNFRS